MRKIRIKKLTVENKSPTDMRGKHTSGNSLSSETRNHIKTHIQSFPKKRSHYTKVSYLSENLDVKKMYNLFKTKYPNEKVCYESYWRMF